MNSFLYNWFDLCVPVETRKFLVEKDSRVRYLIDCEKLFHIVISMYSRKYYWMLFSESWNSLFKRCLIPSVWITIVSFKSIHQQISENLFVEIVLANSEKTWLKRWFYIHDLGSRCSRFRFVQPEFEKGGKFLLEAQQIYQNYFSKCEIKSFLWQNSHNIGWDLVETLFCKSKHFSQYTNRIINNCLFIILVYYSYLLRFKDNQYINEYSCSWWKNIW